MLHLGGLPESSALRDSQAFREIDLLCVEAATQVKWSLVPAQRSAEAKVCVVEDAEAGSLSLAAAQAIVKGENGQLSASDALIAAQLDGATCAATEVLVIVGGLRGLGEVAAVELEQGAGAARVDGPATVRLSGAGALGAVAAGSLIWFPEAGVLVACIAAAAASAGRKSKVKVIVKL